MSSLNSQSHDAIVVGSGATGGLAAQRLTRAGLRVLVLEAGPELNMNEEAQRLREPPGPVAAVGAETLRRQSIQSRSPSFNERTKHLFVDDVEQPYSAPCDRPFSWIRSRQVGGRTAVWNGVAFRFSRRDFTPSRFDDGGVDWPIGYEELAAYYDCVERMLGVIGVRDGHDGVPDGQFLTARAMNRWELGFKSAVERRWPERRVLLTRYASHRAPHNPDGPPTYFMSSGSTLAAARRTGLLEVRSNAVVTRVVRDRVSGLAHGVEYVDTMTRQTTVTRGTLVLLCASTLETTRILLNSDPAFVGESDALGRYLMDHTVGVSVAGTIDGPPEPAPRFSKGIYIPRFRNVNDTSERFLRGYGIQGVVGSLPVTDEHGRGVFSLTAFGEMLPAYHNHVTLDDARPDAWGVPTLRIDCRFSDNERTMMQDQHVALRELADAAGLSVDEDSACAAEPGLCSHEVGTARMGSSRRNSVVDSLNRCWDVPNVLVTDGACFASSGTQNPTLTMMAITARACDAAVERLRRGEV